jgi:hypothetical protein
MKFSSKRLTVLVLVLAIAGCAPKNGELTKAQMREDVAYFFTSFLKTHPNPYCRATPKQVDSIKTALLQKIDKGLAKEEFLNEVGKLSGLLDGHSYIESPLTDHTDKDTLLLPTSVRVNTDLTLSLIDDKLPATNTITSINGIPSKKIITQLNGMLHADPGVVAKREIEFRFPVLLSRAGFHAPYTINLKTAKGNTTIHLEGAAQVAYSKRIRAHQMNLNEPELGSSIFQRSKIAILYFNTCQPKNEKEFRWKIDSLFAAIQGQGIKYLFIDNSRNNGGSSKWGGYLISKINHEPYKWLFFSNRRITKEFYDDIHRQTRQVLKSDSAKHLSSKTRKAIRRNTKIPVGGYLAETFNNTFPAVTNGYSGKVYMLVSSESISAGSDAAWSFRLAKAGKILGDKSGSGNPMYVFPAKFTLPNSKFKFGISVRQGGLITFQGKKMVFLKEPEPDVPFNINPFKTSYSEQELLALLRLANKK